MAQKPKTSKPLTRKTVNTKTTSAQGGVRKTQGKKVA